MFRSPNGNRQQMLASLYDSKIGYCQGLGFVIGPLLIYTEAVSILVRFTEHYDLQSYFLPDLSGLHLQIYQFQSLLSHHFPKLCPPGGWNRLDIEPLCFSPWFLPVFAVTCPLLMLLWIYDVLLLEGACKTLIWIALSLM